MKIILFDTREAWEDMLPLSFTRPIADLRIGINTIREKWEALTGEEATCFTREYLRHKFPYIANSGAIWVDGSILPEEALLDPISALQPGQHLSAAGSLIAFRPETDNIEELESKDQIYSLAPEVLKTDLNPSGIRYPWDIFRLNGQEIQRDFDRITRNRASAGAGTASTIIGNNIFIEEGAKIQGAIINASEGPIYIGKNAEVMEGSVVRGSFAMCQSSVLKLSAKVYGPSTLGPHCKVGGEVNNVVFQGYANKAHDGFLGNAVIGEWCNLGADTNNSNLKNTYQEVRSWNYRSRSFIATGLQFCGLIMGDHSKTGINTMFNTGTVVGVSANIFGSGFPRTFIPSFSWGGSHGFKTFHLKKAFEVAEAVMSRRSVNFDETEKSILSYIYNHTEAHRKD